jgi:hypothetical protein
MPKKTSLILIMDLREVYVVLWETELKEKLVEINTPQNFPY